VSDTLLLTSCIEIESRPLDRQTTIPVVETVGAFASVDGTRFEVINRNFLYLAIGVLVVVLCVVGYQLYKERQEPTGIEINVGKGGISIEQK